MKKRAFILILILLLPVMLFAAGCGGVESEINKAEAVKVVFCLEGGSYQNSEEPITYYYAFKKNTTNLIKDPAAEKESDRFSASTVKRAEYVLDGWYRVRNDNDGNITYDGKWDFAHDRVDDSGVTLYAKWTRQIHYTYRLYYYDDAGALQPIGNPYEVQPGEKFEDYLGYADQRQGYTAGGFFDEAGEPWDRDFVHPGGDDSTEIKVIVKYTRGRFVDVRTAEELIANADSDIRLLADIDFGGEEFGGFVNYSHILDGNGHKISNFKLTYGKANGDLISDEDLADSGNILCISLFGMADGAQVKDVSFEDFVIDIDTDNMRTKNIIVAPLCVRATESTFTGVTVKCTYTLTRLPRGFDRTKLVLVTDTAYRLKDDSSVFELDALEVKDNTNK